MSFNESNKFQEMKSIIDDVNNILVELKDEGVSMIIEPSNDIRVKMASIRDSHFYINFLRLAELKELYPLIIEKIHMLIDYLDEKGFYTEISVKTYGTKRKDYSETAIQIEELESNLEKPEYKLSYINLRFFHNEVSEYNESNKFQEMKSILQDIKHICVELVDENLIMDLEPSINNEIRVKMASIRNDMFYLYFMDSLSKKQELYPLIIEKIHMISEYLLDKGYNTKLNVKFYFNYPDDDKSSIMIEKDMTPDDLEALYNTYNKHLTNNTIFIIKKLKLDFDRINKEVYESLPNQKSVDQLERVMKISAKTDIGNRISDMNKQGANIHYMQNPIETGIESREEYDKHNKSFRPSWNLKHLLSPFANEKKKNKKK
jgi:hypothetical protein